MSVSNDHPEISGLLSLSRLGPEKRDEMDAVRQHVAGCEECRARLADLEHWDAAVSESKSQGIPLAASALAESLFNEGGRARRVVPLRVMPMPSSESPVAHLAADTGSAKGADYVTTLYSERPEIVVRIARRSGEDGLTLTLLSDDPSLIDHAVVQLGKHLVVADSEGIASLAGAPDVNPETDPVQVLLPAAAFEIDLSRLQHDGELEVEDGKGNTLRLSVANAYAATECRILETLIGHSKDLSGFALLTIQDGEPGTPHLRRATDAFETLFNHALQIRLYDHTS